jgi:hypothetical protein
MKSRISRFLTFAAHPPQSTCLPEIFPVEVFSSKLSNAFHYTAENTGFAFWGRCHSNRRADQADRLGA